MHKVPKLDMDKMLQNSRYTTALLNVEKQAIQVIAGYEEDGRRAFRPKMVRQVVEAERSRLENMFQQSPGFICILRGPGHVYEIANDAYYQLVGHRRIIGHELAEVLPEVIPQGFLDILNNVYRHGVPYLGRAVPIALQRTEGAPLEQTYVDLMYQPIRDDAGTITGIFVHGIDVTQAHQRSLESSSQAKYDPFTEVDIRRLRAKKADEASLITAAIADDRFVMRGQKIIPISDRADGPCLELLALLQDENGNLIPPDVFMPAAKRYGHIEKLDYHIIRKAFHYLSGIADVAIRPTLIVNLSGITLGSQNFVASILHILSEYSHVDAGKICFEITDMSAITHLAKTSWAMKCLGDKGFSFALDYFGSGMSFFGYVEQMPVTFVKIDGAFIRDIYSNPVGLVLVEAVTKVAQARGMRTIAVQVENLDQLASLKKLGVNRVQGYALHRPEPLSCLTFD